MNHAAAPLELTEAQRATVETIARSKTAAHREVLRARVLLSAADGVANSCTAEAVGVSVPTVREWRARFGAEGLAKFGEVRKGRGRKPEIPQAKVDEIVRLAQSSKPEAAYLTALEGRLDADLDCGVHREVVGELEGLVADRPFRERFWAQLVRAPYRTGSQTDALRACAKLRELLVEQLAVEPSAMVRSLEQAVLRLLESFRFWAVAAQPALLVGDLRAVPRPSE